MPGVPMYIRVQLRTPHLWYGRTRTIGVPQHDMKHTMDTSCGTLWNTSTMDVPRERSIHISLALLLCRSRDLAPVSSLPRSHYFFHFSSMSSLSSRYFSFRILPVIGSKVNRSKVIFSSRSLPLVPRERSFSCSFFLF